MKSESSIAETKAPDQISDGKCEKEQMTLEKAYERALEIFDKESQRWRNTMLLERRRGNYEKAIAQLCHVMRSVFWTPVETLSTLPVYLNADRMEEIIADLSKKYAFRYSRVADIGEDVSHEWLLRKRLYGRTSYMTVQFCKERYIHIHGDTDSWNTITHDYYDLEAFISSWAEGGLHHIS